MFFAGTCKQVTEWPFSAEISWSLPSQAHSSFESISYFSTHKSTDGFFPLKKRQFLLFAAKNILANTAKIKFQSLGINPKCFSHPNSQLYSTQLTSQSQKLPFGGTHDTRLPWMSS